MTALTVHINGEARQLAPDTSLEQIVIELSSGPARCADDGRPRGVAVAVNDSVVPRGQWCTTSLRAGDHVEIVRAVQGG
ncbi:sulfur carrier protein ThiS [Aeromicrobium sp. CF3.5]|uniref:sulfur carrier protein ThiS n=1 Tax=Aeromicrobium sp. CF3.5 TaxID=3373078 RepID=UPI003EE7E510